MHKRDSWIIVTILANKSAPDEFDFDYNLLLSSFVAIHRVFEAADQPFVVVELKIGHIDIDVEHLREKLPMFF